MKKPLTEKQKKINCIYSNLHNFILENPEQEELLLECFAETMEEVDTDIAIGVLDSFKSKFASELSRGIKVRWGY